MLKITIMPLFISKPFAIGNGDQMPRSSAKNLARTVLEFPDFFVFVGGFFFAFGVIIGTNLRRTTRN